MIVTRADKRLDDLYLALANPARRRIVKLLSSGPHNISELAPEFDMSLTAVAKHVRFLERAGIVQCSLKGRVNVCRLKPKGLSQAYAWLSGYEKFWQDGLLALEKVLAEEAQK